MTKRKPDWDVNRLAGEESEEMWREVRTHMYSHEAEVKRDDEAHKTGHVYVEYECFRAGEWTRSGISTTRAPVWVIHIEPLLIVLPTLVLKDIVEGMGPESIREEKDGSHPTRGMVLLIRDLITRSLETWHRE
jgi:hypothetical protein